MANQIVCLRCTQLTDAIAQRCEICGVDLICEALNIEKTISKPFDIPTGSPLVPEVLVPRLGEYLIEKDVLTPEDLCKALDYQNQKSIQGQSCRIGQALIELDLIDQKTLDEAITEQILELHSALQASNNRLEQRVLERTSELRRALNKLTEVNKLKSNFVSNISHELRTPLTHIKGYLDLFHEGNLGPLTQQQQEALVVLLRAESRLERLIEDLIQFSLLTQGDLVLQSKTFAIDELINLCISKVHNKANEKNIEITSNLNEHIPEVSADEEKIKWVIMQLLDNAIKFTPESGKININAEEVHEFVTVAISDTGIGIPVDRINEMFEPFHQLDGSITRRYAGTGLGLTIAHKILCAHGVTLKVESTVGEGSCFSFSLPAIVSYVKG
jgi:signal transduction histidine kinase